jgi:hypothetical protein
MRHPFHPMRLATVTFKTWQAQKMRQASQPCNIHWQGQHHRIAHEGKVALQGWLGFRQPEGEFMTILEQEWLQHGHAAKDFDQEHQVIQLQRAVARACWDLTLHQSPAVAIDEDCSKVEHARTHKVPHHVTLAHTVECSKQTTSHYSCVRFPTVSTCCHSMQSVSCNILCHFITSKRGSMSLWFWVWGCNLTVMPSCRARLGALPWTGEHWQVSNNFHTLSCNV